MTDYAKHIETFNGLLQDADQDDYHEAAEAAIDLMRAAAPKSEAEEREHCCAVVRVQRMTPRPAVTLLVSERAAARASAYAQGRADGYQDGRRDGTADREHQTAQLTAAQAEIEQLRERLDDCVSLGNKAVAVVRAAGKTEIERLRAESEEHNGLLTKLTNLREAAERAVEVHPGLGGLRAAIEASR